MQFILIKKVSPKGRPKRGVLRDLEESSGGKKSGAYEKGVVWLAEELERDISHMGINTFYIALFPLFVSTQIPEGETRRRWGDRSPKNIRIISPRKLFDVFCSSPTLLAL